MSKLHNSFKTLCVGKYSKLGMTIIKICLGPTVWTLSPRVCWRRQSYL